MTTLRRATIHDALLFYALRLDPETRRFTPAFDAPLSFDGHIAWFAARVWDAAWYVAERNGQPVGIVRLDDGDRGRWVSIIVAPNARGRGVGLEMLRALAAVESGPFFARVHQLNTPSLRVFEKAGYGRVRGDGPWVCFRKDQ